MSDVLTRAPHHASADPALVAHLAAAVADQLVEDRMLRAGGRGHELSGSDERELASHLIARQLDLLARHRLDDGDEPLDRSEEAAVSNAVLASVLGLGRIQPLLDDPDISDIHIRGTDPVWLKLRDGSRVRSEPVAATDDELVELIRVAAARMGRDERRFDAANPELNLQLPDGSRLFAVMAVSSRPAVVIRRHRFELSDLRQLQRKGLIDLGLHQFLASAVRARRNLVIAGGTGSGKTTLLRALLNEVPPHERIVTIEDAYELGIDRFGDAHPDHDMLQSRPANTEGRGAVSMADLTKMALRMDPDRVVVGEVRGAEAFPMLLAMSQGNNGSMCTLHADSTRSAFPKLAAYVSMAETGLPIDTVNLLVANALHFVVHIEVVDGIRRVTSVREVVDADGARIVSNEIFRRGLDGRAVPGFPMRDATLGLLEDAGYDASLLDKPDGWWDR